MNIAAYCRVSTEKEDQLNSLEAQKRFFQEYTERSGDRLVALYADEGISGTKIKNRRQFLQMMADAEQGLFDQVVVKDISRFARNTVDLLQSIRRLRQLGIETLFLTAGMASMGNSEFVLTMFGALAQEESANTSKRVKFGKKINAEKGRVPNLVFGYDKIKGDYFHLTVNKTEAAVVARIFGWYLNEGYGAAKIAGLLNQSGVRTKRGCAWTQNGICRILENELYTGKIINGKEEVADFLTGRRVAKNTDEWLIVDRPELRIIEPEVFRRVQKLKAERGNKFKTAGERHSSLHLFSTLIKCKDCGRSFHRCVRTYKNTYVKWVCSSHIGKGADGCPNAVSLDEKELTGRIEAYFAGILAEKKNAAACLCAELEKLSRAQEQSAGGERELHTAIARIKKSRQRYMDLYAEDLITRAELEEKINRDKPELERLEKELERKRMRPSKGAGLSSFLAETFPGPEEIACLHGAANAQLRRIIDRIEVGQEGGVEIFLKSFRAAEPEKNASFCSVRT